MNTQNHNQLSYAKLSSSIFSASYNEKKVFFTILFSLYVALSLIRFMRPGFLITCIIMGLGLFALLLLSTRIRREYIPIYVFAGFLATSFLVSSIFVSRTEGLPRIFLHIVSCTGIAMILLRGYVYSWGGYIVFYSFVVYFLMLMFTGVNANSALKFTSWNGISMIMLVACISLYIILSMENKKIDLKPAFFTLVISIWGIGRSGIASSFVLILGLLFVRVRGIRNKIYIVFICLFIAFLFRDNLIKFVTNSSFFGNAINRYEVTSRTDIRNSERVIIWTNYFNNIDIFRLIFGANRYKDPWLDKEILAYNYHNSFINLHSQTGFMGLIIMALIIFSLFKYYRTNKVFFFLLLALILRSSTDLFIFFSRFDFIPFFFIFYYLKKNNVFQECSCFKHCEGSSLMESRWR